MTSSWIKSFLRRKFAYEAPYERSKRLLAEYTGDPLDGSLSGALDAMGNLEWSGVLEPSDGVELPAVLPNIDQLVLAIKSATDSIVEERAQDFTNQFDWHNHPDEKIRAKYFFVTQQGQPIPLQVVYQRLSEALNQLLLELNELDIAGSSKLQYHYSHLTDLLDFSVDVLRCLILLSRHYLTVMH